MQTAFHGNDLKIFTQTDEELLKAIKGLKFLGLPFTYHWEPHESYFYIENGSQHEIECYKVIRGY